MDCMNVEVAAEIQDSITDLQTATQAVSDIPITKSDHGMSPDGIREYISHVIRYSETFARAALTCSSAGSPAEVFGNLTQAKSYLMDAFDVIDPGVDMGRIKPADAAKVTRWLHKAASNIDNAMAQEEPSER